MFDSLLSAASEPVTTAICVRLHSPSSMLKSQYSFNPLWTMSTTIFQETSNLYHILEPISGRLFQKIIFGCSLRSSFIDPFNFATETLQHGFGAFYFQSYDRLFPLLSFLFFFSRSFSIFMVTSDRVLNQLNRKRNELQHHRLERGVSKYGSLKNEYSRALNVSYTFQLLMSFWC